MKLVSGLKVGFQPTVFSGVTSNVPLNSGKISMLQQLISTLELMAIECSSHLEKLDGSTLIFEDAIGT